MYIINQITDDPRQTQTLIFEDGTSMILLLEYKVQQYGWFASITYGTFQINGFRICTSPNILRQYKNQIPFGICCSNSVGQEPTAIGDFSSGNSNLYLLSAAEVAQYEAYLSGQTS